MPLSRPRDLEPSAPEGKPEVAGTRERAEEIFSGRALTVSELRAIGLFGGLDDELLAYLCSAFCVELHPAGAVIVREGEHGRSLFVVLEGEVDITKERARGGLAHLALLGPGSWFGAMALIDVMPRATTVQAVSPVRLLRVRASDLDALYRRGAKPYALLMMNLARQLSRELRIAHTIIAEMR
jgi:CRP-like cAMP-binding protein